MLSRFLLLATFLVVTGCSTVHQKRIQFDKQPVAARVTCDIVDEDTVRYSVIFRNTGCEIISFDYTIGDMPCVVHVDSEGPNSGVVENLYPGAEVEVENPFKQVSVYITLGRVVTGKRSSQEITEMFRPSAAAALAAGNSESIDDSDLPVLFP